MGIRIREESVRKPRVGDYVRMRQAGPIFVQWCRLGEDIEKSTVRHACKHGERLRELGEGAPDCEISMSRDVPGKLDYKCTRCGVTMRALRIAVPGATSIIDFCPPDPE